MKIEINVLIERRRAASYRPGQYYQDKVHF